MKFPVALQLYSVRGEMEKDFEGTLKKVSEMGYDGVEFAGLFGKSAEEVKSLCEKYNLTPISAHIPYVEMTNDLERIVATYKKIGCKYIVIPYMTEEYRPGVENYGEVIESIVKIGTKVSENGMLLLYHNHDFEFVKINGEYGLDILYNSVDKSLLQTELDTCWVNVGGENPSEYIRKYSFRTPVVHLKDFDPGNGQKGNMYKLIGIDDNDVQKVDRNAEGFSFRPCGYGVQDFEEILKASHESGANWVVVEQDEPSLEKTPLECAKMSIDYIQSINK